MPPLPPRDGDETAAPRSVHEWIRETYGDNDVASTARAREVREINQRRFAASLERKQKPARVS